MTDLSLTIAPKSDQLNSDDLIGGPITITITKVSGNEGSAEQPINIFFEGDNGKPYRPCKSMRRVLVQVWGKDGASYVGRSMTLYRDPEVQFGGMKVGGTRISHMSHIDSDVTMALTATRANRRPFTVSPLKVEQKPNPAQKWANAYLAKLATLTDLAAVQAFTAERAAKLEELRNARADLAASIDLAVTTAIEKLSAKPAAFDDGDADFSEGPADSQRGEAPALDQALAEIAGCEIVPDVNSRVRAFTGQLSDEDMAELQSAAMERIAALKASSGATVGD